MDTRDWLAMRIDPVLKEKLRQRAKNERRKMTAVVEQILAEALTENDESDNTATSYVER